MEGTRNPEVTDNMEEKSGVLGASGMLRQSPKDKDEEKTESPEKMLEEIDVEGNSDDEVEDSRPAIQGAEKVGQKLGQKLEEVDRSSPPREVDVVGNSETPVEKSSKMQSSSDQQLEKPVSSPEKELKADTLDKKVSSEKGEQNAETGAPKSETEKDQVPESKVAEVSEKASESSAGQTFEDHDDQQEVVAGSENNKQTTAQKASDQKASAVAQPKGKISEHETKPAARLQKLKTFEDAFKQSLGKLSVKASCERKIIKPSGITSKPVEGASQRPLSETQHHRLKNSERVGSVTNEGEKESGQCSSSEISGSQSHSSLDLTACQNPSRDVQAIGGRTFDDEGDNFRDVDNFSSDSSSTIIDIEMATKESTEEELTGKLGKSETTSQDQDSKAITDEAVEPGTRESNPISDTKSGGEASDECTKPPSTEDTSTLRRTPRTVASTPEPYRIQETRTQGDTQPEKRREVERTKNVAKQRERSKSDEGQFGIGKKFRISKHGIVLQPGVKLEAMDYSKKWYLARIVSVDETDNTVLIHFAGWNSRFDEWLEFDSDRLRPVARVSARRETAKEVKALGGYKVGDEVLARWSDCRYYPAKILGIKTNGSYRVLFYDGIEKIVMGINVRDMPETLRAQKFFTNLEHQFRALLNKKQRGPKDAEGKSKEGRLAKESTSGSRPSSPVQQPQKRRHPSASQTPATQPAKRSRQESGKAPKGQKGYVKTPEPVPPSPTFSQDQTDLLPSPTSSEASELMSALEHGMMGGKKRYREPLIFDKNSGLIRDPRRLVAPKELVIDLDHNKYKCEVPDCGKGFRKASLLEYHKKYYHINKPVTSTSAMTAAKNAVTRSRKRLSTSAMAPGICKMRRTESMDGSPAKITNRPMRALAPSIMTTSYKRPLATPKLDSPTQPTAQPPKTPMSSQFLRKPDAKQTAERKAVKLDPPPSKAQTLPAAKAQGSEVMSKVAERSRRVSGTSGGKEDKPGTSKREVVTTTMVEKPTVPPKAAASTSEVKIKTEPGVALPSQKPETKLEESAATNKHAEVKGQIPAGAEVAGVVKAEAPKKPRRNKPHKKHKRHKTRGRDRRSRDQNRSERRRSAERAKQRRAEQRQLKQQLEAALAAGQKPEDTLEWMAKYLPVTSDKNLPQIPAQGFDEPTAKPEAVDSSTEDGGPRDMISCICRNQEEEGFMIQCESCYGWQHGGCVGLTEHTVPKQYICSFCIYPENLRTQARHRYDQDWFRTGRLPTLTQPAHPEEESSDLTDSMLKTHQLMADMIHVTEALDGLQHKLEILKSENHPDLKLWSHHWGLKEESTPRDDSAHTQQLQTSLEESDLLHTSAETSVLTESMRSDVIIDSIAMEEVVTEVTGTSDAVAESGYSAAGNQPDGPACEMGLPQEGSKPVDAPTAPGTQTSLSDSEAKNQNPQDLGPDSVNTQVSPMEVDSDKPLETSLSSQATKSESEQIIQPAGSESLVTDKSAPLSSNPQETLEVATATGKPTVCVIPDPEPASIQRAKDGVTNEGGKPVTPVHDGKPDSAAKDVSNDRSNSPENTPNTDTIPIQSSSETGQITSEAGEPGTPKHDGKADGVAMEKAQNEGDSSDDDEPLIKYIRKPSTSSETESKSTSTAAKTNTPPPPEPSPTLVPVPMDTAPSGDQTVPASICKLNLFNHIVCVEEELKRRMDYVEEQIEALELAFKQSAGSKDSPYIPPDPLQVKQTISTLMDDLERVNKLVSI